jgi:hypothetical protein
MTGRALKFLAVPLAALTLVGALAVSTKEAEARRWHRGYGYGYGAGIGIAAAIIGTAALAAAASQPQCRTVAVVDRFGNVVGYREVC